ncbi:MAG: hypothetical protein HY721_03790 [Planctomycetes bacterium]|nr:hypothetical protein [Planctomycetota bacterium]
MTEALRGSCGFCRSRPFAFLLGLAAGCGAAALWFLGGPPGEGDGEPFSLLPALVREASAELGTGDFEFFPNRRTIWIVNRSNGRMAMYHFHDDEVGSVDRSRVAAINLQSFPREDTVITLSDRNLNNVLWVCNVRTGDVQMWTPARDGSLKAETPIASSNDLSERPPEKDKAAGPAGSKGEARPSR